MLNHKPNKTQTPVKITSLCVSINSNVRIEKTLRSEGIVYSIFGVDSQQVHLKPETANRLINSLIELFYNSTIEENVFKTEGILI